MDLAKEAIDTLRNAPFPIYALPPSRWPGDVMLGGVWGKSLSIRLRYDEDLRIEQPSRRIGIETTGPQGRDLRPPHDVDLASEFSYPNQIINFTHPFAELEQRPVPGSERFNADLIDGQMVPKVIHLPSAGPRRLLEQRPFRDEAEMEPVEFEEHPELRLYRIRLPEVEIVVLSWGYEDGYISELITELRPIGARTARCSRRSRGPSTEHGTGSRNGITKETPRDDPRPAEPNARSKRLMVMELIFAKGEVAGPLGVGDVLVALGIALTYLSVIVFVVTSERRALRRCEFSGVVDGMTGDVSDRHRNCG